MNTHLGEDIAVIVARGLVGQEVRDREERPAREAPTDLLFHHVRQLADHLRLHLHPTCVYDKSNPLLLPVHRR